MNSFESPLVTHGPILKDRVRVRKRLNKRSEDELREICFDRGFSYDSDLPGDTKSRKVIELIEMFERQGQFTELHSMFSQGDKFIGALPFVYVLIIDASGVNIIPLFLGENKND